MATPFAAQMGLPVLLAARACMGIGEGVAMPAMNNLLSRCCCAAPGFLCVLHSLQSADRLTVAVSEA